MISAWTARQERVHSLYATWVQDRDGVQNWSNFQSAWLPEDSDSLIQPEHSLKIHDGRLRYETNRWYHRLDREYGGFRNAKGQDVTDGRGDPFHRLHFQESAFETFRQVRATRFADPRDQRHAAWRLTRVFDGARWTDLFAAPVNAESSGRQTARMTDHSEAVIRHPAPANGLPPAQVLEDLGYRAMLLAYRPWDAALGGMRSSAWALDEQHPWVDGRECLLVKEKTPGGFDSVYFIDPQREYVVLRVIYRAENQPRLQLDIRYRQDPADGWIPTTWLNTMFAERTEYPGHDQLPFFASAKVTSVEFNQSIAATEFQASSIPPKTLVLDEVQNQVYITRDQGGRRIVTRSEMSLSDADFAQVAATETGQAPQRTTGISPSLCLLMIMGVLFITAGFLSLRQRGRKKAESGVVSLPSPEATLN